MQVKEAQAKIIRDKKEEAEKKAKELRKAAENDSKKKEDEEEEMRLKKDEDDRKEKEGTEKKLQESIISSDDKLLVVKAFRDAKKLIEKYQKFQEDIKFSKVNGETRNALNDRLDQLYEDNLNLIIRILLRHRVPDTEIIDTLKIRQRFIDKANYNHDATLPDELSSYNDVKPIDDDDKKDEKDDDKKNEKDDNKKGEKDDNDDDKDPDFQKTSMFGFLSKKLTGNYETPHDFPEDIKPCFTEQEYKHQKMYFQKIIADPKGVYEDRYKKKSQLLLTKLRRQHDILKERYEKTGGLTDSNKTLCKETKRQRDEQKTTREEEEKQKDLKNTYASRWKDYTTKVFNTSTLPKIPKCFNKAEFENLQEELEDIIKDHSTRMGIRVKAKDLLRQLRHTNKKIILEFGKDGTEPLKEDEKFTCFEKYDSKVNTYASRFQDLGKTSFNNLPSKVPACFTKAEYENMKQRISAIKKNPDSTTADRAYASEFERKLDEQKNILTEEYGNDLSTIDIDECKSERDEEHKSIQKKKEAAEKKLSDGIDAKRESDAKIQVKKDIAKLDMLPSVPSCLTQAEMDDVESDIQEFISNPKISEEVQERAREKLKKWQRGCRGFIEKYASDGIAMTTFDKTNCLEATDHKRIRDKKDLASKIERDQREAGKKALHKLDQIRIPSCFRDIEFHELQEDLHEYVDNTSLPESVREVATKKLKDLKRRRDKIKETYGANLRDDLTEEELDTCVDEQGEKHKPTFFSNTRDFFSKKSYAVPKEVPQCFRMDEYEKMKRDMKKIIAAEDAKTSDRMKAQTFLNDLRKRRNDLVSEFSHELNFQDKSACMTKYDKSTLEAIQKAQAEKDAFDLQRIPANIKKCFSLEQFENWQKLLKKVIYDESVSMKVKQRANEALADLLDRKGAIQAEFGGFSESQMNTCLDRYDETRLSVAKIKKEQDDAKKAHAESMKKAECIKLLSQLPKFIPNCFTRDAYLDIKENLEELGKSEHESVQKQAVKLLKTLDTRKGAFLRSDMKSSVDREQFKRCQDKNGENKSSTGFFGNLFGSRSKRDVMMSKVPTKNFDDDDIDDDDDDDIDDIDDDHYSEKIVLKKKRSKTPYQGLREVKLMKSPFSSGVKTRRMVKTKNEMVSVVSSPKHSSRTKRRVVDEEEERHNRKAYDTRKHRREIDDKRKQQQEEHDKRKKQQQEEHEKRKKQQQEEHEKRKKQEEHDKRKKQQQQEKDEQKMLNDVESKRIWKERKAAAAVLAKNGAIALGKGVGHGAVALGKGVGWLGSQIMTRSKSQNKGNESQPAQAPAAAAAAATVRRSSRLANKSQQGGRRVSRTRRQ